MAISQSCVWPDIHRQKITRRRKFHRETFRIIPNRYILIINGRGKQFASSRGEEYSMIYYCICYFGNQKRQIRNFIIDNKRTLDHARQKLTRKFQNVHLGYAEIDEYLINGNRTRQTRPLRRKGNAYNIFTILIVYSVYRKRR